MAWKFHWNSTEISVNSKGKFHFLVPTLLKFGILGGASEWEVIDGLRRAALPPSVEDQEAEGGDVCERLMRHLEDNRMQVRDLFRTADGDNGYHHPREGIAPSLPANVVASRLFGLSAPSARKTIASAKSAYARVT